MNDYRVRTFLVPGAIEEQFVAELWASGALGFESRPSLDHRVRLDAYFESSLQAASSVPDMSLWQSRGVQDLGALDLPERDWLKHYREVAKPFDVGQRFRIDPRDDPAVAQIESARKQSSDRFELEIPARTAFGTGSHESTGLAIRWLEALNIEGLSVLDVGCGSGILSFAAELLGAGRVVGFDIDAQAVCLARGYARRNRLTPRLFAGRIACLVGRRSFDLALVNVLPENIQSELPGLADVLTAKGRVISSGNLVARRDELLAAWAALGFDSAGEQVEDEWAAWLLQRR